MAIYGDILNSFASRARRVIQTLRPVRKLVQELRPQIGHLLYFNEVGTNITLSTTPQKITLFNVARQKNTEVVANDVTNSVTVNNPDGLGLKVNLGAEIDVANNRAISLELYVDDVATGIIVNFFGSNNAPNQFHGHVTGEFPDGAEISLYIYATGASSSADIYSVSLQAEKIPLFVDQKVTTASQI